MNRMKRLSLRWIDTSWVDPSRAGRKKRRSSLAMGVAALGLTTMALAPWTSVQVFAQALPGGTLDLTTIVKYDGQALVIPPVMPRGERDDDDRDRLISDPTKHDYMYEDDEEGRGKEDYKIAVRQFKQQILPGGLPPTTVWSYGPAGDPTPALAPDLTGKSRFNYPAYTVETRDSRRVNVRWINELVGAKTNPIDINNKFLPHLLSVDQTLHWANPPGPCFEGSSPLTNPKTDCTGGDQTRYNGPVPIVTHVHGAHVDPVSDGYPEAWWLPAAKYIAYTPFATSALHGRLFNDATGENSGNRGYADYSYRNDQAATTLWYHDHALGMTRSNVYAGPAGFWLIRGGKFEGGIDTSKKAPYNKAILPGPAPHRGQTVAALNTNTAVRRAIREIPIAIQDRSFNADGSLFYPASRAFFEGVAPDQLLPPPPGPGSSASPNFAPNTDVNPIWNPEFFGNVMVVNGRSWPELAVAPDRYRFRLLNGTNSRTLNLSLIVVSGPNSGQQEIPFYQIGAEQGFLPQVVRIRKGEQSLWNGAAWTPVSGASPTAQALLMGNAERADVIVDFSGLEDGTIVRMVNTGPDFPFNGFGTDYVPADSSTTGQVMQFKVNKLLSGAKGSTDGKTTAPENLKLNAEPPLGNPVNTRYLSVNELDSSQVCVSSDGDFTRIPCGTSGSIPFGPVVGLLGTVNPSTNLPEPMGWAQAVTETPAFGSIEQWQIYNFTIDSHPIHQHLVAFQVVGRSCRPDVVGCAAHPVEPSEAGYKDTVIAYPGEITTVKAKFDIPGLYVWHCHIVEHEDNEMMRPYVVMPAILPPHDDHGDHHHGPPTKKHHHHLAHK